MEKWSEAIEMLSDDFSQIESQYQGIHVCKCYLSLFLLTNRQCSKIQSSALYFKGVAYAQLNKSNLAKKAFLDALQVDFRCFQVNFGWSQPWDYRVNNLIKRLFNG